ncbi:MAG: AAA family ATPase, partial [Candidatus Eisenbacteria bacterium]|nr:AAA family ATPase [Candidatus Eisenbacteria bacterium]
DIPVLITGETGTGKELVARALHYGGGRREKPFVAVNCASLPKDLVQSELFGYEKGAFTGAHASKGGAFDEAEDGTIFLDEIGDMDLPAQAALLHVLETGEYRSVGGGVKRTCARVLVATNHDLEALVRGARFRKDLFYRVNRMRVEIPPVRLRKEDIPLLARHFLERIEARVAKGVGDIASDAMEALVRYGWPGNVRELRNEIERAYIHAQGRITALDLSPMVTSWNGIADEQGTPDPSSLEDLHRLVDALKSTGGNVSRAAEALGVHRNTVHRWMRRFGLGSPGRGRGGDASSKESREA